MLNQLSQNAAEKGLQLLYLNHDFEFEKIEEGIVLLDYLLENTDPKYINFEMDLYWVKKAGANPSEFFQKYPGHFIL